MAYIYELGYGTHEESEFSQLVHRRKFSQKHFERMVLGCVTQATKMECELHLRQWGENWGECHEFEKDSHVEWDDEPIARRKYELEQAMSNRLSGDESVYHRYLEGAYNAGLPGLSYQDLHSLVVWCMCENYGFKPIEKLRTVCFSGWDHLNNVHGRDDKSITARASRLVRRFLKKFGDDGGRSSAVTKWSTNRERVLRKNPAGGDDKDRALCEELGVEFVPYNHPEAVKARDIKSSKKSTDLPWSSIDEEMLALFGCNKED